MPLNHVLIAGAGIGGLCLAQGLRRAGISCAVYESTAGIVQTGYRLHMNATGGNALQRCLPPHLFALYQQTSRRAPRREGVTFLDTEGNELGWRPHIGPPNDPEMPHTAVNRRTLRQIMYAELDNVHFDHLVTGYTIEGEQARLLFADGSDATGDLLVGADGINSVVRRQLLPEVPTIDIGRRALSMRIPLSDELIATMPDAAFDGFAIVLDENELRCAIGTYQPRRPIAEAVAELAPGADIDPVSPYLMAVISLPTDSAVLQQIPDLWTATPEQLHDVVRKAVSQWHPSLRGPFDHVDLSTLFPQSMRRLDPPPQWPSSRVTLLGDAIHAMPPNFGSGGNSALRDAAALTDAIRAIADGSTPLVQAISDYESRMRAEVFPILRASADPRALEADFLPADVAASR
jgi:2-polyprenyl-6-methoxyphenol hydroxylase-like FAD-dependent oxidoreductase